MNAMLYRCAGFPREHAGDGAQLARPPEFERSAISARQTGHHVIDPDISDDVRDMIQRHLATIDHIELLTVMRAGRDKSFSLSELVGEVHKPEGLILPPLAALVDGGLVAQLSNGTYRYSAREETQDRTAEEVIRLYNERPVTLVRLLYERPPSGVHTFADSFKLRKDP